MEQTKSSMEQELRTLETDHACIVDGLNGVVTHDFRIFMYQDMARIKRRMAELRYELSQVRK